MFPKAGCNPSSTNQNEVLSQSELCRLISPLQEDSLSWGIYSHFDAGANAQLLKHTLMYLTYAAMLGKL